MPPATELHQLDQNQHLIPSSSLPEIDDTCPDLTEVQRAMKMLKNGRCRGCDGITGEQLKYCENIKLQRYVHALVTRVWIHGDCPQDWRTSRLLPLWKGKGSATDASKYRGLMSKRFCSQYSYQELRNIMRQHCTHHSGDLGSRGAQTAEFLWHVKSPRK